MKNRPKKRLLAAVLVAFALWPAAHHLLARRLDLDPWLLLGWSMYTVPDAYVQINVAEVRGDRVVPVELPPGLHARARRFAIMRESLGTLARPNGLAGAVLAERRGLDGVIVAVRRLELDRGTARIVARDRVFRYDRDGRPSSEEPAP